MKFAYLSAEDAQRLYEAQFKTKITSPMAAEPEPKDSSSAGLAEATWDKKEPSELETRPTDGVVVISGIGNDTTADGQRVAKEFAKFNQRPLPLPGIPELAVVRGRLIADFPYALAVIDEVLEGLSGRPSVHLRPTIFLGAPGSGKTRFARRLTEELGTPYELISCGGLSDSAIGGTARRWSSGEPSLAVMVVRRNECAGPVVILDEIEKIATSRKNGNVHDVLIGLFEPETSSRWHDPYLQAHCDLSRVTWLMTANSLEPIPAALRDRCRILHFPDPEADQLSLFATRILERLYIEAGHDPRWATPLEGFELDAFPDAIKRLYSPKSTIIAQDVTRVDFAKRSSRCGVVFRRSEFVDAGASDGVTPGRPDLWFDDLLAWDTNNISAEVVRFRAPDGMGGALGLPLYIPRRAG